MASSRPRSILLSWLMLVLCLALCAPPLFVGLRHRPSTHTMEHIALLSSQETWIRQHAGEGRAWLMPTNNGIARIVKPPMLVWLNLAAWTDLKPGAATPEALLFRARLISIATGLAMIAGIFWLGRTLGDLRLAVLSALSAGAMLFLQRQMRTASYDIEFTAWATLAVAAGTWALAPLESALNRGRRLAGWLLAGLFMACSWMTKNPLALVLAAPPLLASVILLPRHGRRDWTGLLIAMGACLLLVAPWHLYAIIAIDDALATLLREFKQPRGDDAQPPYYYFGVFGLVFPFCFLLIAGLYHPFDWAWKDFAPPDPRTARRIRLVPFIWFLLIFAFFSVAEAKQQRYILPIIAPAALLIGRVWCDHGLVLRRAPERIRVAWISGPHWFMLTLVSVAIALVGVAGLAGWRLPPDVEAGLPLHNEQALALGGVLIVVAATGWRLHQKHRAEAAGLITAAWSLIAAAPFWFGYSRQPTAFDATIHAAQSLREELAGETLWYPSVFPIDLACEEEFRFYYGDFIRPADRARLADATTRYVLAESRADHRALLDSLGYALVRPVAEGPERTRELWARASR
jgi:4-amino-4-deoxy-L-arabinose transferase-like glycosyltransferase